jgi:hypothetical protein
LFFFVEAFLTFSYFGGARIHARTAAPFVEMRAKKKHKQKRRRNREEEETEKK